MTSKRVLWLRLFRDFYNIVAQCESAEDDVLFSEIGWFSKVRVTKWVLDNDKFWPGNRIQAPEAPPLTIKIEPEDIPQDPEDSDEPVLRRSTRNRVQRQLFSPTNKGKYHKTIGFAESEGESRSDDPQDETPILTR